MITVNSIKIPAPYIELCAYWHGGQSCMMFAIAGTGKLTADDCTEETYLELWTELKLNVDRAVLACRKDPAGRRDMWGLMDFEFFVRITLCKLKGSYSRGLNTRGDDAV